MVQVDDYTTTPFFIPYVSLRVVYPAYFVNLIFPKA